jgi:predicted MPP superfamily phosphohydrolase
MPSSSPLFSKPVSRRRVLKTGLWSAAALALYAGEIERHWIEETRHDIYLAGLPAAFDGMRIAQLSDIHLEDFTEPFFLRHAIKLINRFKPDAVLITGDFVTADVIAKRWIPRTIRKCADLLTTLECRSLYAVLGNHDMYFGGRPVTQALTLKGIHVLRNTNLPIERQGSKIWLAGVEDPLAGRPNLDRAIPESIRGLVNEPVILLCHGPDFADQLLAHPAGSSVGLMLSGHTHGGQIRVPFLGPVVLPPMGRKYVAGLFHLGSLQLYVNRGLGAIGLPFRFDCPPEISFFTLRARA